MAPRSTLLVLGRIDENVRSEKLHSLLTNSLVAAFVSEGTTVDASFAQFNATPNKPALSGEFGLTTLHTDNDSHSIRVQYNPTTEQFRSALREAFTYALNKARPADDHPSTDGCVSIVYIGQVLVPGGDWLLADSSVTGQLLNTWLDSEAAKSWWPQLEKFTDIGDRISLQLFTPLAGSATSWPATKSGQVQSILTHVDVHLVRLAMTVEGTWRMNGRPVIGPDPGTMVALEGLRTFSQHVIDQHSSSQFSLPADECPLGCALAAERPSLYVFPGGGLASQASALFSLQGFTTLLGGSFAGQGAPNWWPMVRNLPKLDSIILPDWSPASLLTYEFVTIAHQVGTEESKVLGELLTPPPCAPNTELTGDLIFQAPSNTNTDVHCYHWAPNNLVSDAAPAPLTLYFKLGWGELKLQPLAQRVGLLLIWTSVVPNTNQPTNLRILLPATHLPGVSAIHGLVRLLKALHSMEQTNAPNGVGTKSSVQKAPATKSTNSRATSNATKPLESSVKQLHNSRPSTAQAPSRLNAQSEKPTSATTKRPITATARPPASKPPAREVKQTTRPSTASSSSTKPAPPKQRTTPPSKPSSKSIPAPSKPTSTANRLSAHADLVANRQMGTKPTQLRGKPPSAVQNVPAKAEPQPIGKISNSRMPPGPTEEQRKESLELAPMDPLISGWHASQPTPELLESTVPRPIPADVPASELYKVHKFEHLNEVDEVGLEDTQRPSTYISEDSAKVKEAPEVPIVAPSDQLEADSEESKDILSSPVKSGLDASIELREAEEDLLTEQHQAEVVGPDESEVAQVEDFVGISKDMIESEVLPANQNDLISPIGTEVKTTALEIAHDPDAILSTDVGEIGLSTTQIECCPPEKADEQLAAASRVAFKLEAVSSTNVEGVHSSVTQLESSRIGGAVEQSSAPLEEVMGSDAVPCADIREVDSYATQLESCLTEKVGEQPSAPLDAALEPDAILATDDEEVDSSAMQVESCPTEKAAKQLPEPLQAALEPYAVPSTDVEPVDSSAMQVDSCPPEKAAQQSPEPLQAASEPGDISSTDVEQVDSSAIQVDSFPPEKATEQSPEPLQAALESEGVLSTDVEQVDSTATQLVSCLTEEVAEQPSVPLEAALDVDTVPSDDVKEVHSSATRLESCPAEEAAEQSSVPLEAAFKPHTVSSTDVEDLHSSAIQPESCPIQKAYVPLEPALEPDAVPSTDVEEAQASVTQLEACPIEDAAEQSSDPLEASLEPDFVPSEVQEVHSSATSLESCPAEKAADGERDHFLQEVDVPDGVSPTKPHEFVQIGQHEVQSELPSEDTNTSLVLNDFDQSTKTAGDEDPDIAKEVDANGASEPPRGLPSLFDSSNFTDKNAGSLFTMVSKNDSEYNIHTASDQLMDHQSTDLDSNTFQVEEPLASQSNAPATESRPPCHIGTEEDELPVVNQTEGLITSTTAPLASKNPFDYDDRIHSTTVAAICGDLKTEPNKPDETNIDDIEEDHIHATVPDVAEHTGVSPMEVKSMENDRIITQDVHKSDMELSSEHMAHGLPMPDLITPLSLTPIQFGERTHDETDIDEVRSTINKIDQAPAPSSDISDAETNDREVWFSNSRNEATFAPPSTELGSPDSIDQVLEEKELIREDESERGGLSVKNVESLAQNDLPEGIEQVSDDIKVSAEFAQVTSSGEVDDQVGHSEQPTQAVADSTTLEEENGVKYTHSIGFDGVQAEDQSNIIGSPLSDASVDSVVHKPDPITSTDVDQSVPAETGDTPFVIGFQHLDLHTNGDVTSLDDEAALMSNGGVHNTNGNHTDEYSPSLKQKAMPFAPLEFDSSVLSPFSEYKPDPNQPGSYPENPVDLLDMSSQQKLPSPSEPTAAGDSSTASFDPFTAWGHPQGLPAPTLTKAKTNPTTKPSVSSNNRPTSSTRPGSAMKSAATGKGTSGAATPPTLPPGPPIYLDLIWVPSYLAYVPHSMAVEFFSRVRARIYIISGEALHPTVGEALLEGKAKWASGDVALLCQSKTNTNLPAKISILPTDEPYEWACWLRTPCGRNDRETGETRLQAADIHVMPTASLCDIEYSANNVAFRCEGVRVDF